jgi:uncharacterized membrane protein
MVRYIIYYFTSNVKEADEKMHSKTKKIVVAALIASLTCVATMLIKIPSPLKGYLNLGDCVVLLAGWLLSPGYGFVAAGLGSALADLLSGYVTYAPATFLIKGSMALVAFLCFRLMSKRLGKLPSQIIGGVLAELLMIAGYFIFEGFLYGFAPSVINIPANAVQGIAGIILGILLIKIFEKANLTLE